MVWGGLLSELGDNGAKMGVWETVNGGRQTWVALQKWVLTL
jgi:hypothetical protein